MRIDRIKFKNINSLKDEVEVPFGEAPLKDAGIFAIIGPTGSGKSTLLDVITLALYNRVPRINAKAITDTIVESTGTVLTRFADDAYATIEYTTRKGSYISTWSIRKNRNGKLVSPHMELTDKKNGKPMDLKKSEVPVRNEELIGLNYDQFVKSIILSQGEFSKFLKADKNERGNLLEKITGTGIYRSIGRKVYERFKTLERDIELAEGKSELITLLSKEEREEIEKETKVAKMKSAALEKQLVVLQKSQKVKELVQDFAQQAEENKNKIATNVEQGKHLKKELALLSLHEQLNPFVADITLHQEAQVKVLACQEDIKRLEASIKSNDKAFKEVLQKMGDLIKSTVTVEDFMEKMKAFEASVSKMDNTLSGLSGQASKIVADIKQEAGNQDYSSAKALAVKSRGGEFHAIIESEKNKLGVYLKEVDLDTNTSSDSLIKLLNKTKEELDLKNEMLNKTALHDTLQKTANTLQEKTAFITKGLETSGPALVKAQKTLVEDKESLQSIRKEKEKSQKRFNLNDARAALVDGDPCPLCGAVHHPKAGEHEKVPSGFDQEIAKYEKIILATEKRIQGLEKDIATATADQKNALEKAKENEGLLKENKAWFLSRKLSMEPLDKLQDQVNKLKQKADNYSKGGSSLQEYQWLSAVEKKVDEIIRIGHEYKDLAEQRKALSEEKDVQALTNKLQNEINSLGTIIAKDQGLLKKSEKDVKGLLKQVDDIGKKILPGLKKLGFADVSSVKDNVLSEAKVAQLKSNKATFDKQKIELETQKKSIETELKKLSEKDDSKLNLLQIETALTEQTKEKDLLLQRIGSIENQLKTDLDNTRKIGKLNKELEKMKSALDNWALLNKMIGDKTGSKFANYAQNITLRHLLGIANKRLEYLFKRYMLDMPKKEGELMIVDTYQGNIRRGVSTLSGGETFMISLALALSLSDMASKNVALESLFIDEGFSTLDPEMLDLAMTTLDKIQSESQKTVGIISHVESLKERIDVQIQLEKNAQGHSTLKIVEGV